MQKKTKATSESTTSRTSNIVHAELYFENDLRGFFKAMNYHYNADKVKTPKHLPVRTHKKACNK